MQKNASKRWIFVAKSLPVCFLCSAYLLKLKKLKRTTLFFKKKPVKTGFFHIIILNLFEVSELPLFQKFNGSLDVLVHHPVLAVEWYDRAEFGQEVFQIC